MQLRFQYATVIHLLVGPDIFHSARAFRRAQSHCCFESLCPDFACHQHRSTERPTRQLIAHQTNWPADRTSDRSTQGLKEYSSPFLKEWLLTRVEGWPMACLSIEPFAESWGYPISCSSFFSKWKDSIELCRSVCRLADLCLLFAHLARGTCTGGGHSCTAHSSNEWKCHRVPGHGSSPTTPPWSICSRRAVRATCRSRRGESP